ncbi:acyltransferase family protein [Tsukamurella sp. 1534]|uniref:acyltransferase family protein n=1 Tax=Tsukamurella sp. 1534 TaxID=1151061 RepID=UPI001ED998E7|nr:acyltransferase family protein [Tsukamurella sp. 1534]
MRDRPSAGGYRADLEGLRGIAIALVACFHVWFGRVSGGVDVFLTLSGYFFVGSLLRHALAARDPAVTLGAAVNPVPRLGRLARRLFPALVLVLTAVSALTPLVLPATRWSEIGSQVIASLTYQQNSHLADRSLAYAAADAAGSPLQHLWSMSVQGQFFVGSLALGVVFAGAVNIVARARNGPLRARTVRASAGVGVLLLAAGSFAWAATHTGVTQPQNYYDTLARAWEPLAGGVLAVWLPAVRVPAAVRTAVAALAVGVIATCGWWIDGAAAYPGPWALVPVLATLAIIWAGAVPQGAPCPAATSVLAHPVPVRLGATAYSLYLWHWPVLIFSLAAREERAVSFAEGCGVLAVSLVLAMLTVRFVEDPLRGPRPDGAPTPRRGRARHARSRRITVPHMPSPRSARYGAAVTAILVICAAAMPLGAHAWQARVDRIAVDPAGLDAARYPGAAAMLDALPAPPAEFRPSPLEASHDVPVTTRDGRIADFADSDIRVGSYGDPRGSRTIALAGGSHSEFWITALDRIGRENGIRITTYLKLGCPLATEPPPFVFGSLYPECRGWVDRAVGRILADRPDAVFTTSTRPRSGFGLGDWTPESYVDVFRRFDRAGIPVLGVRDTPWPITFGDRGALDCLADKPPVQCMTPRDFSLARVNPADRAAAEVPLLSSLDLSRGMCDEEVCHPVVGNVVVYRDLHHLTSTFVHSLIPELRRQMHVAVPHLVS